MLARSRVTAPPFAYLTRWRNSREASVAEVAGRVGYESEFASAGHSSEPTATADAFSPRDTYQVWISCPIEWRPWVAHVEP